MYSMPLKTRSSGAGARPCLILPSKCSPREDGMGVLNITTQERPNGPQEKRELLHERMSAASLLTNGFLHCGSCLSFALS